MSDEITRQLEKIADEINVLPILDSPTMVYDVFADAIVWSDEFPPIKERSQSDYWCLRPVVRYRTSVILGSPDVELSMYWEKAFELFPNWPGFEPDRRRQQEALQRFYEERSATAEADLDQRFGEE